MDQRKTDLKLLEKIQVNAPFLDFKNRYFPMFLEYGMNPEIGLDAEALDTTSAKEFEQVAEILNRRHDVVGATDGSQGHISAGDTLGHRHQIRLNPEMLYRKHLTGAPETANNFVDNQENSVLIADVPYDWPVLFRRREGTKALHDRLADER